jgi:hypothetical protein
MFYIINIGGFMSKLLEGLNEENNMSDLLKDLNEQQLPVAMRLHGKFIVNAGAGSGIVL